MQHDERAIFRRGLGACAAPVGSLPRARINFGIGTGFSPFHIRFGKLLDRLLEVRLDIAGLNQNDLHAEGIHLQSQRVAQAFERVLAAAVRSVGGRGDQSRNTAHHQNAPVAPCPHVRQNRLGHPQHSEQVGLKLFSHVFETQFFNNRHVADASVVDEHIDSAALFEHKFDADFDRKVVGDIHLQRADRDLLVVREAVELLPLLGRSSSSENNITLAGKKQRCRAAQAVGAASDQNRLLVVSHRYFSRLYSHWKAPFYAQRRFDASNMTADGSTTYLEPGLGSATRPVASRNSSSKLLPFRESGWRRGTMTSRLLPSDSASVISSVSSFFRRSSSCTAICGKKASPSFLSTMRFEASIVSTSNTKFGSSPARRNKPFINVQSLEPRS